jgi:hypothetical protein
VNNTQIDILVASGAYWIIIAGFVLILSRRVSKISSKLNDIERQLSKKK